MNRNINIFNFLALHQALQKLGFFRWHIQSNKLIIWNQINDEDEQINDEDELSKNRNMSSILYFSLFNSHVLFQLYYNIK
jgi:hypothetical protein